MIFIGMLYKHLFFNLVWFYSHFNGTATLILCRHLNELVDLNFHRHEPSMSTNCSYLLWLYMTQTMLGWKQNYISW